MTIWSNSSQNGSIVFADNDSNFRGCVQYIHNGDILRLFTSGAEKARIDHDGYLGLCSYGDPDTAVSIKLTGQAADGTDDASDWGAAGIVNLYNTDGSTTNSEVLLLGSCTTGVGQISSGFGFGRESASNWGTYLSFKTHSTSTSNIDEITERVRIDSNGNMGLGTASVGTTNGAIGRKFGIKSDNNNAITFETTNATTNRGLLLESRLTSRSGGETFAQMHMTQETGGQGGHIRFYTAANGAGTSERVRISSSGKLRVGAALDQDAAGKFQVVEESGADQANDCNAYFETNAGDWNIKTYYNKNGAHYHIVFVEQGTERGDIRGNDGSNVTYNSGSDYRWKENIVRMTGTEGIEICKKLQPSKYNWIENREITGQINTVDGFIAHEVVEAGVLGAVTGEKDAVKEDGSIDGQMLDYGQMTPVLTAAIKGLIDKVETLEAKVAALEG